MVRMNTSIINLFIGLNYLHMAIWPLMATDQARILDLWEIPRADKIALQLYTKITKATGELECSSKSLGAEGGLLVLSQVWLSMERCFTLDPLLGIERVLRRAWQSLGQ